MQSRHVGITICVFILSLSFCVDANAGNLTDLAWKISSRFRYGLRTTDPLGLATLQSQTEGELSGPISSAWTYQIGARLTGDGAHAIQFDRYQDLYRNEVPAIELREANLEYRSGPVLLRVGSQVIVWGEAFGAFYADIVNPKDLREAGFGDISDLRIPIEMMNLQYIQNSWSAQLVYIPFYRPNRLPRPGSDFFPRNLKSRFSQLNLDFDQSSNPEDKNGDFGLRGQGQIGSVDFSAFVFSHIDRSPLLRVIPTSFTSVKVRTSSTRTLALGVSFSWATDDFVVRGEGVRLAERSFNVDTQNPAEPIAALTSAQEIAVLGVDIPLQSKALRGWQVGLQVSDDRVDLPNALGRARRQQFLGLQLMRDSESDATYQVLGGTSVTDGSWLIQTSALFPQSDNMSIGVDAWIFEGAPDSQLGALRDGSRLMFIIKGAFRG